MDQQEKDIVQQGAEPREWSAWHKDCEARGTKKLGKSFYVYKLHANGDVRYSSSGATRSQLPTWTTSTRSRNGLDKANTTGRLYADRGYDRRTSRELLLQHDCKYGRHCTASAIGARNKAIDRCRSRVQHVFAGLRQLGGKTVHALDLSGNELPIAIKCAAYNVKRLASLWQNEPAF